MISGHKKARSLHFQMGTKKKKKKGGGNEGKRIKNERERWGCVKG